MELESTRIFVKVVQQGSFSKAAQIMKVPVSTVSRTVSRLEGAVGTKLLQRTTRSLKLTSYGKAFFESCVGPIQILEDARRSLQGQDSIVAGPVKITAPEDLGAHVVTPVLASILRQHPAISIEFNFTDEVVDLVGEGYDLALRVGRLNPSRFRARKVGEISIIAVANPSYLSSKPRVREPKDLEGHNLIVFTPESGGSRLVLSSKKGKVVLTHPPKIIGNQMGSLLKIAAQGVGIAWVPQFACRQFIDEGQLVRVLPDWSVATYPVSLISSNTSEMPARIRIVADQLIDSVQNMLKKE